MKRFAVLLSALLIATGAWAQLEPNPGSEAMATFIADASQASWYQLTPEAALDQIDALAPFILDVRAADELTNDGYIEGAVNIPLAELDARKSELPQDPNASIVVYCSVGIRGNFGLTYLRLLGYNNAQNIRGGYNAWVDAGFPIIKN